MKHLRPINVRGRKGRRRPVQPVRSESCEWGQFAYPATVEPVQVSTRDKSEGKQKKAAA